MKHPFKCPSERVRFRTCYRLSSKGQLQPFRTQPVKVTLFHAFKTFMKLRSQWVQAVSEQDKFIFKQYILKWCQGEHLLFKAWHRLWVNSQCLRLVSCADSGCRKVCSTCRKPGYKGWRWRATKWSQSAAGWSQSATRGSWHAQVHLFISEGMAKVSPSNHMCTIHGPEYSMTHCPHPFYMLWIFVYFLQLRMTADAMVKDALQKNEDISMDLIWVRCTHSKLRMPYQIR